MKYLLLFGFILFLNGCSKERMTLYYANLKNTTSHKIEIRPYFNGIVPSEKIIVLLPNDIKQIAEGTMRGISGYGFISGYFGGPNDSVIIVFDNTFLITHYFNTPTSLNSKHYLFSSKRNIGNPESYKIISTDISKYKRENRHTYEFKEQDYLDAK